jgi:hypothetical protein
MGKNLEGRFRGLIKACFWQFPVGRGGGLRETMRGFRISDFPSEIQTVYLLNTNIQQNHDRNLNYISTK